MNDTTTPNRTLTAHEVVAIATLTAPWPTGNVLELITRIEAAMDRGYLVGNDTPGTGWHTTPKWEAWAAANPKCLLHDCHEVVAAGDVYCQAHCDERDFPGCECEVDWNCPLHADRVGTWIETRYDGDPDLEMERRREAAWA